MKRIAILLLLTTPAAADPPPGVPIDPEMHEYYHSLKVPAGPFAGGLCCSIADCRNVVVRSGYRYTVWCSEVQEIEPP
jgi:hypothetical protein